MTILLIIATLVALLYIGGATFLHRDLPASVSQLVFSLPRKYQFLWTLFIWVITFCIAPPLLSVLSESTFQFVGFLTVAALAFVGALPLVYHDANTAHTILANIAGIGTQLCVMLINPWWLLVWFVLLPLVIRAPKCLIGKGICLVEIVCFITLVASIYGKLH